MSNDLVFLVMSTATDTILYASFNETAAKLKINENSYLAPVIQNLNAVAEEAAKKLNPLELLALYTCPDKLKS